MERDTQAILEEAVRRLSPEVVEQVIDRSDEVISECAEGIERMLVFHTAPNAREIRKKEENAAVRVRRELEGVWRPIVQRRICELALSRCGDVYGVPGDRGEKAALNVAEIAKEQLIEGASPRDARPYGVPFVRASLPVDRGGYDGWDRDLLLSPYLLSGHAGELVALVPHDEPGMRDGLISCVVDNALSSLMHPTEAKRLPEASFAPALNGQSVPWDVEEAPTRLAEIRERCEDTVAGRVALALGESDTNAGIAHHFACGGEDIGYLWSSRVLPFRTGAEVAAEGAARIADADDIPADDAAAAEDCASAFMGQCGEMVRDLLSRACDGNPQEAEALMSTVKDIVHDEALAAVTFRPVPSLRHPERVAVDPRLRMSIVMTKQHMRVANLYEIEHGLITRGRGLAETALGDLVGTFQAFASFEKRLHDIDPAIVVGFSAMHSPATMPEAERLLDLTDGWARMCRAAAVLSCPEYGAVIPCEADMAAGTMRVLREYDETLPKLPEAWRPAFGRQQELFADEMERIRLLYEEARER